jgi:hypothetical protein
LPARTNNLWGRFLNCLRVFDLAPGNVGYLFTGVFFSSIECRIVRQTLQRQVHEQTKPGQKRDDAECLDEAVAILSHAAMLAGIDEKVVYEPW